MSAVNQPDLDALLTRKQELAAQFGNAAQLRTRLRDLRAWQAARLLRTYGDLARDERFASAITFFLSDVYGASDFSLRDRDLVRAWPVLKRSLPAVALATLGKAMELEVLTAELDRAMVAELPLRGLGADEYAAAYRRVGRRQERERQIELVIGIGESLQGLVRRKWVGVALRAAHAPARVAGFGALQDFLERGYRAFSGMTDARFLLATIRRRETQLMEALLANRDLPLRAGDSHGATPHG